MHRVTPFYGHDKTGSHHGFATSSYAEFTWTGRIGAVSLYGDAKQCGEVQPAHDTLYHGLRVLDSMTENFNPHPPEVG